MKMISLPACGLHKALCMPEIHAEFHRRRTQVLGSAIMWNLTRDELRDLCGTEVEHQIIDVSLLLSVTRPTYV